MEEIELKSFVQALILRNNYVEPKEEEGHEIAE